MSEPFLAEIRMVGFNFPPRGWSFTDGQILPISQNQSLFSLLGTTYGGDGRTTFALPDLRGRTPVHRGDGQTVGQRSGAETISLTVAEMPYHMHHVRAGQEFGNNRSPDGRYLSQSSGFATYRDYQASSTTTLLSGTVSYVGGSQPHDNMQPYIAVSFCIALQGFFPSRN